MTFAKPSFAARHLIAAAFAVLATAARAEQRDFCPERPGLNTPPCIVDSGRLVGEVSAIDWTLEREAGMRTDTVLAGGALLRLGLSDRVEAQLGWTAFGHARVRAATGVMRHSGTGDVIVALKIGLAHPDGQGFSVALKPYATLPTGGRAIGAGTWGAGVLLPVSFETVSGVQIIATPEIDATPDQDGNGRHLAWGSAGGVQLALAKSVSMAVEAQLIRDDDPAGHSTRALGEVSLAWQPGSNTQIDLGAVAGLNHDSPDVELIAGIARRF